MTTPIALHLDPADLQPPHGPDHQPCLECDRMRRQVGHVPLSLRETLSSLTPEDRAAYALSSDEWRRRAYEEARLGHLTTAETFLTVARVAESVARRGMP